MSLANQPFVIAGREFRSRLLVGTGKFSAPEVMRAAPAAGLFVTFDDDQLALARAAGLEAENPAGARRTTTP